VAAFFKHFPATLYKNTVATNIIAKVRFSESVRKNAAVYYPYTVKEGERPDQIAAMYYDDPHLDWVVYLANDITDPLHDWHMSQSVFGQWIKEKYGSVANAMATTAFYRVNWQGDDRVISTASYQALGIGQKQYWTPVLAYDGSLTGYERTKMDCVAETNAIVNLTGTFTGVTADTPLKQINGADIALGTVAHVSSTTMALKHITGTWTTSGSVRVASTDSVLSDITITAAGLALNEDGDPLGIPTAEQVYWSAVDNYTAAAEVNESRKHIRLLHASYVPLIERDMRGVLANG
jgi:hypothetical protein